MTMNLPNSGADPGGAQGAHAPPPIFGLAVPNLSPTLHVRTPMTPPASPPLFSNPRSAPVIDFDSMTIDPNRYWPVLAAL